MFPYLRQTYKKNCSEIAVTPCIFYCFATRIFRNRRVKVLIHLNTML